MTKYWEILLWGWKVLKLWLDFIPNGNVDNGNGVCNTVKEALKIWPHRIFAELVVNKKNWETYLKAFYDKHNHEIQINHTVRF